MKVSVIIPCYNEEKVIEECLESLERQTCKDMEVVVVDDGSIDGSIIAIENLKLKTQSSKLKVIGQIHKGAGAARNRGVKEARGDILVFVDADMTFESDFIEKLISPILKKEAVGSFSADEMLANKDNVWARCWNLNRGLPADRMHVVGDAIEKQKVFRAILKKEFDKVGGFDEKAGYTDDWSLAEKLRLEAVRARGAVFYHKNPDNLREVFVQARWMAKRKYKFGWLGVVVAMLRVSLPVSLVRGIWGVIRFRIPEYFIFKLLADAASFLGMLEFNWGKRVSK